MSVVVIRTVVPAKCFECYVQGWVMSAASLFVGVEDTHWPARASIFLSVGISYFVKVTKNPPKHARN